MGRLRYTVDGVAHATRVAWIGSLPADLRIETLGLWGQPNLTLLVKGSMLYLHTPGEDRCLQAKATARNLSHLFSISLPAEDLFVMLSGNVPVRPYHHAEMAFLETQGQRFVALYGKWDRLVERLWIEPNGTTVNSIDVFDRRGELAYTAFFTGSERLEDSPFCKGIVVLGEQGGSFSLKVERLSINIEIPDGAFNLPVACGEGS
jgi:hypothetical protein